MSRGRHLGRIDTLGQQLAPPPAPAPRAARPTRAAARGVERSPRLTDNGGVQTHAGDTLTLTTANFNFNDSPAADQADAATLAATHSDQVLGQELNHTSLRALFPGWRVIQPHNAPNSESAAIASRVRVTGHGKVLGVGTHPGVRMQDRWIVYADTPFGGGTARVAALHMPPRRPDTSKEWWPMADHVVQLVHSSPHPVILGADWNSLFHGGGRSNVRALAASLGMRTVGGRIDGFLYALDFRVIDHHEISNGRTRSDHPFYTATFGWQISHRKATR